MTYHPTELAERWRKMSIFEQMGNIGSEVERAFNWRAKNNEKYSRQAAERALELFDMTLDSHRKFPTLKEVARAREVFVDYFYFSNEYRSDEKSIRRYFLQFAYAARKDR